MAKHKTILNVFLCILFLNFNQCEKEKSIDKKMDGKSDPLKKDLKPQEKQHFILSTGAGEPISNKENTGIIDNIAKEAFRRIGKTVEIVQLPAERGILSANNSTTDGELNRVPGLSKKYPNLIQIPEKNMELDFIAFSKQKDIQIRDWNSLKPYYVGIIIGWKIFEKNTYGFPNLTKVRNAKNLFDMLSLGRVDLILYRRREGLQIVKKNGYKNIHIIEPPLVKKDMFMYLNKKHKHLVPQLTEALKQMKRDGSYNSIVGQ